MSSSTPPRRVVIAGGGYAGLRAALDLAVAARRHRLPFELCLVDRHSEHQLVTLLHLAATGARSPESLRLPLRELLPPDGPRLVTAEILAVDLAARRLETAAGDEPWDRLVLALGSETVVPDIPGLAGNGFRLRQLADGIALSNHLRSVFALAGACPDEPERRRLLRFVVAGGGASGVQLAAELAHWVPGLADEHGVAVEQIHLVLCEARDRLLPEASEWAAKKARALLEKKGVDVRCGTRLTAAGAASVELGGLTLPTATLAWCGGVEAPAMLARSGISLDGGRVPVDDHLRLVGRNDVWVVGDTARCLHRGRPLPATAAVALRQGSYVASVIVAEALGRTVAAFRPREPGMLVSLGGGDAIGDVLGVPVEGHAAGRLKDGIEHWYQAMVTRRLPLIEL